MNYLKYLDIKNINDTSERFDSLSETIKSHILEKKNELHLKQSIIAWSELSKLVKYLFNIASFDIIFSKNGKPSVLNNLFYFSISHSNDYVVVVVGDVECGVDIEYHKKAKDYILWCKKEATAKLQDKSIFKIKNEDLKNGTFKVYDKLITDYTLVIALKEEQEIVIL